MRVYDVPTYRGWLGLQRFAKRKRLVIGRADVLVMTSAIVKSDPEDRCGRLSILEMSGSASGMTFLLLNQRTTVVDRVRSGRVKQGFSQN